MESYTASIDLRAAGFKLAEEGEGDAKKGTFEGYASIFGNEDSHGDICMPGAFSKALKGGNTFPLLFNHWSDNIVGLVRAEEDEKGLYVKGELTPGHSKAMDCYASMKHGALTSFSFGAGIAKGGIEPRDPEGKTRGFFLKELMLQEVSLVVFPANKRAKINPRTIKSSDVPEFAALADVEEFLRDGGYSHEVAKTLLSRLRPLIKQGPAVEPPAVPPRDAEKIAEVLKAQRVDLALRKLKK